MDTKHRVAIRLTFEVRHIGNWRGIEASGKEVRVKGFRFFRIEHGKIAEQWALIDGESLQASLTEASHGCECLYRLPARERR